MAIQVSVNAANPSLTLLSNVASFDEASTLARSWDFTLRSLNISHLSEQASKSLELKHRRIVLISNKKCLLPGHPKNCAHSTRNGNWKAVTTTMGLSSGFGAAKALKVVRWVTVGVSTPDRRVSIPGEMSQYQGPIGGIPLLETGPVIVIRDFATVIILGSG